VAGSVHVPPFSGATEWLNTEPLGPADLDGHVLLVNFWTLTCINWLRQAPHVRGWAKTYRGDGLIVIGVHTPEFSFEHVLSNVRQAIATRQIDYPVVVDNDHAIWSAFANDHWPALYFVDRRGVLQDQYFGEGRYRRSDDVLQQLLGIDRPPAGAPAQKVEAAADWANLRSSETYIGDRRSERFADRPAAAADASRTDHGPGHLTLNQWTLDGDWTIGSENAVLGHADGAIRFRFHARDAHLVLAPGARPPIPFRVTLDGAAPGPAHGIDVDAGGNGMLDESRLYQLIRQPGPIREHTLEIAFANPGAEAYVFTFG
jgi:thiol-disulfide isomerase/thioredoxin